MEISPEEDSANAGRVVPGTVGPRRRGLVVLVGGAVLAVIAVVAVALAGRTPTTPVRVTSSGGAGPGGASIPPSAPTVGAGGISATTTPTTTGAVSATTPVPTTAPPHPASTVSTAPPRSTVTTQTTGAPPSGGVTVAVTEADSTNHYNLHRGDHLAVTLTGPAIYTWSPATSSNGAVLTRTSASSGATANALFLAAADGEATVSATATPNCYPQCLPPTKLFQVTVTVTG